MYKDQVSKNVRDIEKLEEELDLLEQTYEQILEDDPDYQKLLRESPAYSDLLNQIREKRREIFNQKQILSKEFSDQKEEKGNLEFSTSLVS